MKNKLPSWLRFNGENIIVNLRRPAKLNGVACSSLILRPPLVRDVRNSHMQGGDDEIARELHLFASLGEVSVADLDGLHYSDYQRVQAGYFRVAADDDDEPAGPAAESADPGKGTGHPAV